MNIENLLEIGSKNSQKIICDEGTQRLHSLNMMCDYYIKLSSFELESTFLSFERKISALNEQYISSKSQDMLIEIETFIIGYIMKYINYVVVKISIRQEIDSLAFNDDEDEKKKRKISRKEKVLSSLLNNIRTRLIKLTERYPIVKNINVPYINEELIIKDFIKRKKKQEKIFDDLCNSFRYMSTSSDDSSSSNSSSSSATAKHMNISNPFDTTSVSSSSSMYRHRKNPFL